MRSTVVPVSSSSNPLSFVRLSVSLSLSLFVCLSYSSFSHVLVSMRPSLSRGFDIRLDQFTSVCVCVGICE